MHLILKPWKRGGLEDFSRTKENEMTAATFDHQVGKALEFFEQQRNEKTACARFHRRTYFKARLNLGCAWKRIPCPLTPSRDQNPRGLIENCGKVHFWLPTQAIVCQMKNTERPVLTR